MSGYLIVMSKVEKAPEPAPDARQLFIKQIRSEQASGSSKLT